MLFAAFIKWWYGAGWLEQAQAIRRRVTNIGGMFSVPILLRTMFAPWKQTVSIPRRDQALNDKIQAWIGNQVSRFVGFGVRIAALIAAGVSMALVGLIGGLTLVIWPIVPALPIILLFVSLLALDSK